MHSPSPSSTGSSSSKVGGSTGSSSVSGGGLTVVIPPQALIADVPPIAKAAARIKEPRIAFMIVSLVSFEILY